VVTTKKGRVPAPDRLAGKKVPTQLAMAKYAPSTVCTGTQQEFFLLGPEWQCVCGGAGAGGGASQRTNRAEVWPGS
jgi:hypothetical protein